DPI
ncbi:hypothetical protein TeGR_g13274, partial [Tetraparma gracilis]